MQAPHKPKDHPIASPDQLVEADAIIFAFPTRFGSTCAQMQSFFDATGGLWNSGALVGKPVTCAVSTATQVSSQASSGSMQ
jgi:NAD(P)H dehydrogenase (quinone)